ncbi:DUF6583 family protein [Salirhabdus salicampi]|uniref:DUF6583 family protein n=1 Tax=Salirhabdus salicampi TaxID=476102 RepID=UPI0020C41266|nr:DUF6583 family protein [Salirhabdus salicampi]MCP8615319.1 hypothetical protein [Salirhabdus salicampi]
MVENQAPKKNKKSIWLVVSALLVVLLGAVGVFAYQNFISNPLAQYLSAEKKTFEEVTDYYEEHYGNASNVNERLYDDAYEADTVITGDLNIPTNLGLASPTELSMLQSLISSASISTNVKVNPDSDEMYGNVDISLQGSSLANGVIYQNDEITAAQVPFLYNKFFVLQNNRFGDFMRQSGHYYAPIEEIPNLVDMYQTTLTPEESKEMAKDYLQYIVEQLDEDKFEVNKGVAYLGEKYTKLSVNLEEYEVKQLFKGLLRQLRDDDRFWDLMPKYQMGDLEQIKENFEYVIDEVDNLKFPQGFTYEAFLKNGLVEHRKIRFTVGDGSGSDMMKVNTTLSTVINGKDDFSLTLDFDVQSTEEEEHVKFVYKEDGKPQGNGYSVARVIDFSYADHYDDFGAIIDAQTIYENNTSETSFDVTVKSPFMTMDILSGTLNTSVSYNNNEATKEFDLGLHVDLAALMMGNEDVDFNVHSTTDITFTEQLDFPAINGSNSVDVLELTPAEIDQITREVEENLYYYFGRFNGLF